MNQPLCVALIGLVACQLGAPTTGEVSSNSVATAGDNSLAERKCPPCLTDDDCAADSTCAQAAGDNFCLTRCRTSDDCPAHASCTLAASTAGDAVVACVPSGPFCGNQASPEPGASEAYAPGGVAPVNHDLEVTDGIIGGSGGSLPFLHFAMVGDTRPPHVDDTANYPTPIITRIWQDIEAESPRPPFAIATGDYQFARSGGPEVDKQFDLYLGARAAFRNTVFFAMGNHECGGHTFSNCGPGTTYGLTTNFATFKQRMLAAIGQSEPYYTVRINADDGSWSAKFVFVAPNNWSARQATWVDAALKEKTTYTFVVRHEASYVLYSPGVHALNEILDRHDYTLVLAGHRHTFSYDAAKREVISGTGGAPLATAVNYGYVVGRQTPDGAIQFWAYDYDTHATAQRFAVWADGSPAPVSDP